MILLILTAVVLVICSACIDNGEIQYLLKKYYAFAADPFATSAHKKTPYLPWAVEAVNESA